MASIVTVSDDLHFVRVASFPVQSLVKRVRNRDTSRFPASRHGNFEQKQRSCKIKETGYEYSQILGKPKKLEQDSKYDKLELIKGREM